MTNNSALQALTAVVADAHSAPSPTADAADAVHRAETLAHWLDNRFRIPGTNYRVGLDGLLGLVPGIGDTISAALSTYIIGQAWRHNLPKRVLVRMGWNVAVDTVVGAVPLAGDVFDFAWKANRKNAALLAEHLVKERKPESS